MADVSGLRADDNIPQCCCGKPDCALLAHNGTLLDGLERDVRQAASLGQVRIRSLTSFVCLFSIVASPHCIY